MPFSVPSKIALVQTLRNAGIDSPFFDLNAIDTVGSCMYHKIKEDIQGGNYTTEHFVAAYVELQQAERSYTFGEIQITACDFFIKGIRRLEEAVRLAWQDGVM